MHQRHIKKYYVGGMISLICLPILFLVSTIENRKKAICYGGIVVNVPPAPGMLDYDFMPRSIKRYYLQGGNDSEQLVNFKLYLETLIKVKKQYWQVDLPQKCNYGYFVKIIDLLQKNNYESRTYQNSVLFLYKPEMIYQQEYEPLNTIEEFDYFYTAMTDRLKYLKWYYWDEQEYKVKILKYSDYGPPPGILGMAYYSGRDKEKKEPVSMVYFHNIDLWFVPIIIFWIVLFCISIKKSIKIAAQPDDQNGPFRITKGQSVMQVSSSK